jgi:hypothetical protein
MYGTCRKMTMTRNPYKILVGKPEEADNIKMDFTEIGCGPD